MNIITKCSAVSLCLTLLCTLPGCATLKSTLASWGGHKSTHKTAKSDDRDQAEAEQAKASENDAGDESSGQAIDRGPNPYLKKIPELDERYKKDFQSGIDQMKAGDWSSAIKTWRALAKALPKASGVRLNLAISLSEQGDLRAARTALDAGIAANKRNVELYNWAGMIARRQGEFTQAEQYYQTGIDQWAGYPPLFLNLGILYEVYLNEKEKALKQYRVYQALQAKPDSQVSKWIVDLERRVSTP